MILTKRDLAEFESAIERAERYEEQRYHSKYIETDTGPLAGYGLGEIYLTEWLLENPQVVMAGASLQEYVGAHRLPLYRALIRKQFIGDMRRPAFRTQEGRWFLGGHRGSEIIGYSFDGLRAAVKMNSDELFDASIASLGETETILKKATSYLRSELLDPTAFVSPKLWTPGSQEAEKLRLHSTVLPLIRAIQNDGVDLASVHWRELEGIVAEVLRRSGMEIHSVQSTPQGGRDLIARVLIAPGEVLTIAVEVKHRKLIDRPILHTALHQNANFPALMLVTSGRFTAGILQEARRPENRMRLFLKDGVAIRDMIAAYPLSLPKRAV